MTNIPPLTFKKAPLTEVVCSISFFNNLQVADNRSKFHRLIEKEFPFAIMPENSGLTFNFGDYMLYTENQSGQLEVGMNYFRYRTAAYPGYQEFRTMFISSFSIFRKCYKLNTFKNFFMQYRNTLPLPEGYDFEKCFTIDVTVPEELQTDFMAAKGALFFDEPEGNIGVEIDPILEGEKIMSYALNLSFSSKGELDCSQDENVVERILDAGHGGLEKFFFSILRKEYLAAIGAK